MRTDANISGKQAHESTEGVPQRDRALRRAYRRLGYTDDQIDLPYFIAISLRQTVEAVVDATLEVTP